MGVEASGALISNGRCLPVCGSGPVGRLEDRDWPVVSDSQQICSMATSVRNIGYLLIPTGRLRRYQAISRGRLVSNALAERSFQLTSAMIPKSTLYDRPNPMS